MGFQENKRNSISYTTRKETLYEAIPITGSLLSGTYGTYPNDTNIFFIDGNYLTRKTGFYYQNFVKDAYAAFFVQINNIYQGQVVLSAQPYKEIQPDVDGVDREVVVFPLKLVSAKPVPFTLEEFSNSQKVREKKAKKLSPEEFKKFQDWIKLVESESQLKSNRTRINRFGQP